MSWVIHTGDALEVLKTLPAESVHCCVTSPPYWGLRDYGVRGQLGLEKTPELYVSKMVEIFREVRRVLRSDGTLWLNIGDSYQGGNRGEFGKTRGGNGIQQTNPGSDTIGAPNRFPIPGLKAKDLCGIPWLLAFALRSDGWYLRQDIIWSKPNPMPESVTDRCTKAHEYIFLLSKSSRYYYDQVAILEDVSPNTNPRLAQDVEAQIASERANGGQKTNGNMKAVSRRPKAWDVDMGSNRTLVSGYARKLAEPGSGIKSNESFSNAVCCLVEKRNKRSVWEVTTQGYSEAHFATFPPKLIEPCILAGCPEGGTVLDPFAGAGTTGLVATRFNRNFVGIELSPAYVAMAEKRIREDAPLFNAQPSTFLPRSLPHEP